MLEYIGIVIHVGSRMDGLPTVLMDSLECTTVAIVHHPFQSSMNNMPSCCRAIPIFPSHWRKTAGATLQPRNAHTCLLTPGIRGLYARCQRRAHESKHDACSYRASKRAALINLSRFYCDACCQEVRVSPIELGERFEGIYKRTVNHSSRPSSNRSSQFNRPDYDYDGVVGRKYGAQLTSSARSAPANG